MANEENANPLEGQKRQVQIFSHEAEDLSTTLLPTSGNKKRSQKANAGVVEKGQSQYNSCPSCNAKVPVGCFGKHLISHFHHFHLKSRDLHKELILEHIHEIVKQAPFQCHICMFYCNSEKQFIEHWQSIHHLHDNDDVEKEKEEQVGYWCSVCRIITPSEKAMMFHLTSKTHVEIVTVINRNIAIVIKKVQLSECNICSKKFRLKFSLYRHLRKNHHCDQIEEDKDEGGKSPPETSFICCNLCNFKTLESSKMKQHNFLAHTSRGKKDFSCLLCSKVFVSKYAAFNHKNSKGHQQKRREFKLAAAVDEADDGDESCHLCGETTKNSLEDHLRRKHFDDLFQCCICGTLFTSAQKLGAHVRVPCKVLSKPIIATTDDSKLGMVV